MEHVFLREVHRFENQGPTRNMVTM